MRRTSVFVCGENLGGGAIYLLQALKYQRVERPTGAEPKKKDMAYGHVFLFCKGRLRSIFSRNKTKTPQSGLCSDVEGTVKTDISAKSKNAAKRRHQITTQRSGCDLGRRSNEAGVKSDTECCSIEMPNRPSGQRRLCAVNSEVPRTEELRRGGFADPEHFNTEG